MCVILLQHLLYRSLGCVCYIVVASTVQKFRCVCYIVVASTVQKFRCVCVILL